MEIYGKSDLQSDPSFAQPLLSDFGQDCLPSHEFPKSREDHINCHTSKLWGKLAHQYL